ncbi:MAG TPA: nicotinate phosphoribosyltransferase [Anaerolineaceae bacterium]|nr:nicotinate phosphoribosyltransferase [Anaerolineaceae bacterium]
MNQKDKDLSNGVLFTDLYQLTMAQIYYRYGMCDTVAQFDYFFRSYPDYGSHQAGYCINAGLEWLLDWMQSARFGLEEIAYLRSLRNAHGDPLFAEDFLQWLEGDQPFANITLRAIPEGRVTHPNVPVAVVEGPIIQAQLLESSLLNHLNYQTLIATKASRIHESCHGQIVLEFGLRRAQEKAANAGARAAIIGGADATSNVGISKHLGIPPSGTHAHSMIQAFMALGGTELDAFRAYAAEYPDNCILLVDTISTLESGIPNAIIVFEELKATGHKPVGIRLDSGDLAYFSIQAAKMLNEAGFEDTLIVLSNQLDELVIWQIITQIREEAGRYGLDANALVNRLAYGVGTRMITSSGDPALDGVYKLVSVKDGENWHPAMKISESPVKTLNPGKKRVWRLYDLREKAIADLIALDEEEPQQADAICLHHPFDHTKSRTLYHSQLSKIEPLLEDIILDGKIVYDLPSLEEIRKTREKDMQDLYPGVKRLVIPHNYHVSLSQKLWDLKHTLILKNTNGDT